GGVGAAPKPSGPPGAVAEEAAVKRGPPLWRVSGDGGVLWLLGSAHLSSSEQAWRRPEIDAALEAAEQVFLEAALEPDVEVRRRMRVLGVGPPAFSLMARLSAVSRRRLQRAAEDKGLDLDYLNQLRPWLASLTLRAATHQPSAGEDVDSYIERQARSLGKPVLYLETWEAQIRVLAELPEESQIRLLERDLSAMQASPPEQGGLIKAWLAGDDARLEALVFEDADRFPVYFERLFARRNRAWARRFMAALQEDGVVLAVVGAGHLYGSEGLLNLLKRQGRQVERW
nr:TraB/GumN family protein [Paracoccaceae bacterium]